jgi:hypothetical protein
MVGKKAKMKRNNKDIKKGKKSMIRELLETVISAGVGNSNQCRNNCFHNYYLHRSGHGSKGRFYGTYSTR